MYKPNRILTLLTLTLFEHMAKNSRLNVTGDVLGNVCITHLTSPHFISTDLITHVGGQRR